MSHTKENRKLSIILGIMLLGSGVFIWIVYAIAGLIDKTIIMPCDYRVTISALISFGIAFVWKLLGADNSK